MLLTDCPEESQQLLCLLASHKIKHYLLKPGGSPFVTNSGVRASEVFSSHPFVVVLGHIGGSARALMSLLADDHIRSTPLNDGHFLCELSGPYWLQKRRGDGDLELLRSEDCSDLMFISHSYLRDCLFRKCSPTALLPLPRGYSIDLVETRFKRIPHGYDWFKWPNTDSSIGASDAEWDGLQEHGVLGRLGYHVGLKGKSKKDRQAILADLFYHEASPSHSAKTLPEHWGAAGSSNRLKTIAYLIAGLCVAEKRKRAKWYYNFHKSIADREADLAWLKATYYDGRFDQRWEWPHTEGECAS